MVIEGFPAPEKLRDYLYEKMRGARKEHDAPHEAWERASSRPFRNRGDS
jgi:hypothetical protein